MAKTIMITLGKGGMAEKTVDINHVEIPDLWHIAMSLPKAQQAMVLSCWYLAHDMKRELQEIGDNV